MDAQTLDPPRPARPAYDGPVTWADVCADPLLRDLPFKIELDQHGRILMSPTAPRHGRRQYRIGRLIEDALGGVVAVEIAIITPKGTRVPDVVWMSEAFLKTVDEDAEAFRAAPEICVEVRSPSNVWGEMEEKVRLFLAAGAHEVWICEVDGAMRFFGPDGERDRSALAPGFPARIEL